MLHIFCNARNEQHTKRNNLVSFVRYLFITWWVEKTLSRMVSLLPSVVETKIAWHVESSLIRWFWTFRIVMVNGECHIKKHRDGKKHYQFQNRSDSSEQLRNISVVVVQLLFWHGFRHVPVWLSAFSEISLFWWQCLFSRSKFGQNSPC